MSGKSRFRFIILVTCCLLAGHNCNCAAAQDLQQDSVSSFFQTDQKVQEGEALETRAPYKSRKSGLHLAHIIYVILDNLGVPLPVKQSESLNPVLEKTGMELRNLEFSGHGDLERIQPEKSAPCAPNPIITGPAGSVNGAKIPQSELEGTMYDFDSASGSKK